MKTVVGRERRPPLPAPGRWSPSYPRRDNESIGTQRSPTDRQAPLDGRHRLHLRHPQEPPQRPGPDGPAQVRPGGSPARRVPRRALTATRRTQPTHERKPAGRAWATRLNRRVEDGRHRPGWWAPPPTTGPPTGAVRHPDDTHHPTARPTAGTPPSSGTQRTPPTNTNAHQPTTPPSHTRHTHHPSGTPTTATPSTSSTQRTPPTNTNAHQPTTPPSHTRHTHHPSGTPTTATPSTSNTQRTPPNPGAHHPAAPPPSGACRRAP
jgi:hypothetical protein